MQAFKRFLLLGIVAGLGASIGVWSFIQRVNNLPSNRSLAISEAYAPVFLGGAAGAITADLAAILAMRGKRQREIEALKREVLSESQMQALPLEQQAVLIAALETLKAKEQSQ